MSKRDTVLLFDLDDTIVNLSKEVVRIYNEEHNKNYDWKDNDKYWWGDVGGEGNRKYFENLLRRKGVFYDAPPMEDMIDILNNLHNQGFEIYFVTMPDYGNETCYYEKLKWLQKYLPWFEPKMLIATESKHLLAKPNRILVDDNSSNLRNFQQEGGISIGFGNHSWTKEFNGLRVDNAKELECLIKLLEEGDR